MFSVNIAEIHQRRLFLVFLLHLVLLVVPTATMFDLIC